jgi:hypothetical protein
MRPLLRQTAAAAEGSGRFPAERTVDEFRQLARRLDLSDIDRVKQIYPEVFLHGLHDLQHHQRVEIRG